MTAPDPAPAARRPPSREEITHTVHGPRIDGTCSRCGAPMQQAVSGSAWHVGPNCHWHAVSTGCCEFIRAGSDD